MTAFITATLIIALAVILAIEIALRMLDTWEQE